MPEAIPGTLAQGAVLVLETAAPASKVSLIRALAASWQNRADLPVGIACAPDRPARPERPELLPPRTMPKRGRAGTPASRIALLHALAHIELNAMDLACDILCRFADQVLPQGFYRDWIAVADEEAKHFSLLAERLEELGASYGDLPAHDGLWEAAQETAHDLLARLAVVPLVLEAHGLDVTPAIIANLRRAGDGKSADILQVIYEDEVGHVAVGRRWFEHLCRERSLDPPRAYQALVRQHFKRALKPPFNVVARDRAGFPAAYYEPLSR